jgi:hypothetical protein
MRLKSIFITTTVVLLLLVPAALGLYYLFAHSYEEFIRLSINKMGKPHLYQQAKNYFSSTTFLTVRIIAVIITIMICIVLAYFIRRRTHMINKAEQFTAAAGKLLFTHVRNSWPQQTQTRTLLLLILLLYLCRSVTCILFYPIDFDEADSYVLFSSQGPLVAASFYPLPNNHILYSIITSITAFIIPGPEMALRLPLIPIGMFCVYMLFGMLKRFFSEFAALAGLCFFIGSYPVYLFSFLARGYLLLFLFYVLAVYAFHQLVIANKTGKKYQLLFITASIGGLYTIPSFLYALAGFGLYWLLLLVQKRSFTEWKRCFIVFSLIIIGSILLYTPVFITARWESLQPYMNPTYQAADRWLLFKESFYTMLSYFLSPNFTVAVLLGGLIIIAAGVVYKKLLLQQKQLVQFCLLQLLLPLFVFFALQQAFPVKPWMHLVIPLSILVAAIFYKLETNYPFRKFIMLPVMLVLLVSGSFISYRTKEKNYTTRYNKAAATCEPLIMSNKIQTAYTDIPYFKTMISYYAYKHEKQIEVYSSRKRSNRFEEFDPAKKYDLIITSTDSSLGSKLLHRYDTLLLQNKTLVLTLYNK